MATVVVNFGAAMGAGAPAYPPTVQAGESITSSGTSQPTTGSANSGDFAHITSIGGAVWASFGSSPVASAGTTWIIADGETKLFGPLKDGDKAAIIDV